MSVVGELLKHSDIGRWTSGSLFQHRQLQLAEQNLAEYGIRVDVELFARRRIYLLLDAHPLARKALLERREPGNVDRDTVPFHLGQHANQRDLDVAEQVAELECLELRFEYVAKTP